MQLLRRLGVQTNYRAFSEVWDRDDLDEVYRGRRTFCDAFEMLLRAVGLSRVQIDEVEAACQARRRQLNGSARPLPGVKATLARLHALGIPLGVLTNSEYSSATLAEHLERFGVGEMFCAVISSIDLGQTKPDPMCYRAAAAAMGQRMDETAFVGHDAAELGGARDVGMMAIAFNFDPEATADVFLARFEDLLGVVAGHASRMAA